MMNLAHAGPSMGGLAAMLAENTLRSARGKRRS